MASLLRTQCLAITPPTINIPDEAYTTLCVVIFCGVSQFFCLVPGDCQTPGYQLEMLGQGLSR
jgi:hypothetical protein